ncbi:MAG: conjugative transposon protein TraM, partial [Williamsia sp.]|nr:conjugative transposon protein TraM [Williamsia sp.]
LVNDIYVNGTLIPRGTPVFGAASLSEERLKISIGSIRFRSSLYLVSLSVYDLDGMEGIFVPGTISRDVAKESAGQALQGIGLTTLDPSLSAQAASAGIQAAKSLLTRKAKLVRVSVKAGYRVLLKDASLKN